MAGVLCLGILGCASAEPEPEPEPAPAPAPGSQTDETEAMKVPAPLMEAVQSEEVARLVSDMEAGVLPVGATVLYDQMGANDYLEITDPETIRQLYDLASEIQVVKPSTSSITDAYHFLGFELQDGTKCAFRFEGEGLLSMSSANFRIEGSEALWDFVKSMYRETHSGA